MVVEPTYTRIYITSNINMTHGIFTTQYTTGIMQTGCTLFCIYVQAI